MAILPKITSDEKSVLRGFSPADPRSQDSLNDEMLPLGKPFILF